MLFLFVLHEVTRKRQTPRHGKYLLDRFQGNVDLAVAAYNAGPELVAKVGPAANPEAIDYVAAVKAFYANALRAVS